jgi:hypothetical protein
MTDKQKDDKPTKPESDKGTNKPKDEEPQERGGHARGGK